MNVRAELENNRTLVYGNIVHLDFELLVVVVFVFF